MSASVHARVLVCMHARCCVGVGAICGVHFYAVVEVTDKRIHVRNLKLRTHAQQAT